MTPAYQLDGRDANREAFYAAACDPRRHCVVEACAGAGKTWMLVARIVRALLDGAQPHEVLAITFTRKAAGEMRERLAQWLAAFADFTTAQAEAQLRQFGLPRERAAAQAGALIGLHERLLDSGRAVEVCTFHAWYAQLLRAAPMDLLAGLGLVPGMALIEDIADLRGELMHAFQAGVLGDATALDDYRRLSQRHGRFPLGQWFDAALQRRVEIELADAHNVLAGSVAPPDDPRAVERVHDVAFVAEVQTLARALAGRESVLARQTARALIDALALTDARAAYDALRAALFTRKGLGTPRQQIGKTPEQAALCDALDRIGTQLAQHDAHDDHRAMVRLTRRLFADYAELKRRRGLIDMPDLERVALALLSDHEMSGWVQERLDARVRHLLIDEFQDTSPLQWHALQAWLSAYAGAGGGPDAPRVFIVGDPKQSIYRFRRAEPRVFLAAQAFVRDALEGTLAACDHTRRCAPGVLTVVNRVFGAFAREGRLDGWRAHSTEVAGAAEPPALQCLASAERPPRAAREDDADERLWRPSLTVPRVEAKVALRDAEAGAVAQAIDALVRGQGVSPGEILVLARTRAVLARAAEALAALHLPFVAPEELRLAELPEVQDLLAVLDVLASPGQSLSLARALKSPLFEVSDAELLALSQRARAAGGWWPALMAVDAQSAPSLQRAARLLAAWQAAAATLPPHDLLDRIVHEGDLLARLAAVVPPERHARAMEAVRALLAAALELDGGRYASPYNFVRALRQRAVLAPVAAQPDAVRLLTIHGAKGLEARVVLLMDADPAPRKPEASTLLVDWPVESAHPRQVAFVASEARCPPSLQALLAAEHGARAREEVNALYVALTRASERLIVSRTPPRNAGDASSWWARLEGLAQPWIETAAALSVADAGQASFVDWPVAPLPPRLPLPLAPAADDATARLGQAVHRTLEWAAARRAADLASLAAAAAAEFGLAEAAEVQAIAGRILGSPACRRFFDAQGIAWAGAEVPVASSDGQVRRIDRLVRLADGGEWWVLDYKLAGAPQHDPALRDQLADYRAAVAALSPGEPVRAAFITGRGELIELASGDRAG